MGTSLSDTELTEIYLATDGTQTHIKPKLCQVGLDQTEALYLALSYGFDAQRKLLYICRILSRIARGQAKSGEVDPELRQIARELLKDEETLNDPDLTWHKRAVLTEKRMLELCKSVTEERDRLLRHFAGESGESSR
jgi:hypothetical protein